MPRDLDAVLDGMGWQLDDTERGDMHKLQVATLLAWGVHPDSVGPTRKGRGYIAQAMADAQQQAAGTVMLHISEADGDELAEALRLAGPGRVVRDGAAPAHLAEAVRQATAEEVFLAEVRGEVLRARAKFPGDRVMGLALAEEFGELVKAVLDKSPDRVRREAVQTAAMCVRLVLDGDGSVKEWRAARGLAPLVQPKEGGQS